MNNDIYQEVFKSVFRNVVQEEITPLKKHIMDLKDEIISIRKGEANKDIFSVTETATRLGMSKSQVRTFFNNGVLKGYQESTGGKIYIYAESIRRFGRE